MGMYSVYVIRSIKSRILYKGLTRDINSRLKCHNSGKVKSTKAHCPWELVHHEDVETLTEARRREKYLKSGGGRKFIEKVLSKNR